MKVDRGPHNLVLGWLAVVRPCEALASDGKQTQSDVLRRFEIDIHSWRTPSRTLEVLWLLDGTLNPSRRICCGSLSFFYAIVLPGRKSGFRAEFRSDSKTEHLKIGPPAGPPAGREADFEVLPSRMGYDFEVLPILRFSRFCDGFRVGLWY